MGVKHVSWNDLIEHPDYPERKQGRERAFKLVDARDWLKADKVIECNCLIHSKRGPRKTDEE